MKKSLQTIRRSFRLALPPGGTHMKKSLLAIAAAAPLAAFALLSGDALPQPILDTVKNNPVLFDEHVKYSGKDEFAHLRAIVTFATFIPDTDRQLTVADELAIKYADRDLQVVAVSPEGVETILKLVDGLPLSRLAVANDPRGKFTNALLDGAMVSGRAFVVNRAGTVIWDGDADDLPRILDKIYSGGYDYLNFINISGLQQALTIAAVGGDNAELLSVSEKILASDPDNSLALKAFLYASDNLLAPGAILEKLSALSRRSPDNSKLYTARFALCQRYPELAPDIWALTDEFAARFGGDSSAVNRLAWGVLTTMPLDPDALAAAVKLAPYLEAAAPDPEILSTLALLHSRTGRLDKAVEYQQKAISLAPPEDLPALESLLRFYRAASQSVW